MDDQGGACPSIRIIFKKFILLYFQTSNDFDMEYTNNVFSNWQTTPHFYKIQSAGRTTTQHTIISPYFFGFVLEAHNTQFLQSFGKNARH